MPSEKLADPASGHKIYWKMLNILLNKFKVPRIPPLLVHNTFITNYKEKTSIFSKFLTSQCTPFLNDCALPVLNFLANSRIGSFEISCNEIYLIIEGHRVSHHADHAAFNGYSLQNMCFGKVGF